MTGLREQLEAKARRRLVVPVQVSDPTEDQRTMTGAVHALRLAEARDPRDTGEVDAATAAVAEATAAVMAHYAQVELQSLPGPEWEAAMAQWTGEDGVDWDQALPPVLAVSCVDETVRDEQWWAQLLSGDAWTDGDRDQLKQALLLLNVTYENPYVKKG